MVALEAIRESNTRVSSDLPPALVAVFFGATSGIGETSLKCFVQHAKQPRIYFSGRKEESGNRIKAELKALNPQGEYHFLTCDVSLLNNVDDVCGEIKSKESTVNLLFITSGILISGTRTEEGLHYLMAVTYYARMRLVVNLLPLLKQAPSLRRVVTVMAGGKEGPIFPDDFQAYKLGVVAARGHVVSMITLAFEAIAKQAPEVSFVHSYPGFVRTGLSREVKSLSMTISRALFAPVMTLISIPLPEVGERHLFFATSARFPPGTGRHEANGVPLVAGVEVATSTERKVGGGVYSIDYEAEGTYQRVQELLAKLRNDGIAKKVWDHTQAEFSRITGSLAI